MNRQRHEILGDYLDGALPEGERADVERRLREEPDLARELEELRALVSDARALPKDVEPGRDLWPDIERKIGGGRVVRGDFRRHRGWLAAAAAAVLFAAALATGVWRVGPEETETAVAPQERPADVLDLQHAAASREVMDRLDGGEMDPETVQLIRRNLEIIDDAVREIRLALDEAPGNSRLNHMLNAEVQRRSGVLRQAAELSESI